MGTHVFELSREVQTRQFCLVEDVQYQESFLDKSSYSKINSLHHSLEKSSFFYIQKLLFLVSLFDILSIALKPWWRSKETNAHRCCFYVLTFNFSYRFLAVCKLSPILEFCLIQFASCSFYMPCKRTKQVSEK